MKDGIHEKMFSIEKTFFSHFENSTVKGGKFEVKLVLDKRSDLIQMDFDIVGTIDTFCDRCTAAIAFPLDTESQLLVKYADAESEDSNVIYITRESHHINVAKFIHDSICLSVPLTKVYDCREEKPYPCDESIIEKLEDMNETIENRETGTKGSIWDSLKDLKLGNK
jgi:uncharacterized metal-binding protein YceD (DUF177 family)